MKQIPLSQGKFALVDDEDYEWLNQWRWCYASRDYAFRNDLSGEKRKAILMHRQIMKCPVGLEPDHIDGNGINNQRENLRISTHAQNSANRKKSSNNTSGYKGVHVKRRGYIQASIKVNYKSIHLGTFHNPILAAIAYDVAAKKYYGKFAKLNFPDRLMEAV